MTFSWNVSHAPDGTPLALEDAIELLGYDTVQIALLNSLADEYASAKRLKGYPPKVFLSYHRQCPESIRVATFFAERLKSRYHVLLDEENDLEVPHGMGVARFVAQIGHCHIFVPIITNEYLEKNSLPNTFRWWLHEESSRAILLQRAGILDIVCLWLANRPGLAFQVALLLLLFPFWAGFVVSPAYLNTHRSKSRGK